MFSLPAPSQKGFAPIALVVLLLFGIAAGTLLIKNGVNFLPKAANNALVICTRNQIDQDTTDSCPAYIFDHCDYVNINTGLPLENIDPGTTKEECRAAENAYSTRPGSYQAKVQYYCTLDRSSCINTQAPTQQTATQQNTQKDIECVKNHSGDVSWYWDTTNQVCSKALDDSTCQKLLGSNAHYDKNWYICIDPDWSQSQCPTINFNTEYGDFAWSVPRGAVILKGEFFANKFVLENGQKKVQVTNCKYDSSCNATCQSLVDLNAPIAQPAAQPATNTGGCSQTQIDQCKKDNPKKDRCYIDSKNTPQCLFSQSLDRQEACTIACPNSNNLGCVILRGEQKCIYPDSATSCDPKEGANCKLVVREGVKVSERTGSCNAGWDNFCMATTGKSCQVDNQGVPDCTGAPKTPSQTSSGTGSSANSSTNNNRSLTTSNSTSSTNNSGNNTSQTTTQSNTPLICGKDKDGLDIPCFSIGVFSSNELTQREAQAKIASVNYSKFRELLDKEQSKIDSKVAENAKAKIAASEEAMKACMK